jgi:hypothetical protein
MLHVMPTLPVQGLKLRKQGGITCPGNARKDKSSSGVSLKIKIMTVKARHEAHANGNVSDINVA